MNGQQEKYVLLVQNMDSARGFCTCPAWDGVQAGRLIGSEGRWRTAAPGMVALHICS